jgi:alginate O-acetyltransferase complex protein AlgI
VCYITLFPQLVAGPIVRYHEIEAQLRDVRTRRMSDFADGFPRFAHGLFKKVVIADTIAPVADAAFATAGAGGTTTAVAWLGALAYTVQIYFDFSGYTDMAIGLARMFGFRLPENFARPYSAVSVTDFWRRWHLSLSRWFRDYLYIPLGGNRGSPWRTYRNLSIVFLLTGLWHGANWTFIVWGAFHGALLIFERATGLDQPPKGIARVVVRRLVTLLLVVVGWVFFRSPSMAVAWSMLGDMFWPAGAAISDLVDAALTRQREVTLALSMLVVLLPGWLVIGRILDDERRRDRTAQALRVVASSILAPIGALTVAAGTFSPFLYFQF